MAETNEKHIANIQLMYSNIIILDVETTGFSKSKDDIIEIGAIKVSASGVIDEFSTLVKTTKEISERITKITGLTAADLVSGISLDDALRGLVEFCEGDGRLLLVGHNSNQFDLPKLEHDLALRGMQFPKHERYDTMRQMRADLSTNKHRTFKTAQDATNSIGKGVKTNLAAAALHYKVKVTKPAHRALNDCLVTWGVFRKQIIINNFVNQIYK